MEKGIKATFQKKYKKIVEIFQKVLAISKKMLYYTEVPQMRKQNG